MDLEVPASKALLFSDEEQLLFLSRIPNISPRITENASDYLCGDDGRNALSCQLWMTLCSAL
ncbi:hypothetical protein Y696_10780 [Mesotoga sp. H07pep.5.4]|jgi:hypothetical protein|nr:hypothetical protein Y696_10780 [Mesotoga sp. H07pep.5.4]